MKKLMLIVPAVLLAACAMDQASTSTEPTEKVYTTGSNIPRKDNGGVQTVSPEEMEQARNAGRANTGRGPGG